MVMTHDAHHNDTCTPVAPVTTATLRSDGISFSGQSILVRQLDNAKLTVQHGTMRQLYTLFRDDASFKQIVCAPAAKSSGYISKRWRNMYHDG